MGTVGAGEGDVGAEGAVVVGAEEVMGAGMNFGPTKEEKQTGEFEEESWVW